MWHEYLRPRKPMFALNVYSMLKPRMPSVGRNDSTDGTISFFVLCRHNIKAEMWKRNWLVTFPVKSSDKSRCEK